MFCVFLPWSQPWVHISGDRRIRETHSRRKPQCLTSPTSIATERFENFVLTTSVSTEDPLNHTAVLNEKLIWQRSKRNTQQLHTNNIPVTRISNEFAIRHLRNIQDYQSLSKQYNGQPSIENDCVHKKNPVCYKTNWQIQEPKYYIRLKLSKKLLTKNCEGSKVI